ncbi:MAG TPA: PEP-CTERM sorting domain-containing protein [Myxococcota bacterium]|nr:PEP-CTERM sorting domain-containing protein [Myxococcota bacterium]
MAVSADGSTVVGVSVTDHPNLGEEAFRWTASGGMVGLGFLPEENASYANGVSADGSVVVGNTGLSFGEAFRWTASGGMVGLGFLPGGVDSQAYGISADASVVVGASGGQAFRWTASSGMVGLGTLPRGTASNAYGVSADGSVVVGIGDTARNGPVQAFRWTASGGMVGLGFLPGGISSWATAVSADGSTVVGINFSEGIGAAFRWTANDGMVDIGSTLGVFSAAEAVSGNGSVIVGAYEPDNHFRHAFIWDNTHGARDLQQVLTADGLDLTGWTLQDALGISADGQTIVGAGIGPDGEEAWIAVIPEPATGLLVMLSVLGLAVTRSSSGMHR